MRRYGLKLWSNNINYILEAERLYKEGVYQYIELYSVPGTYDGTIGQWKTLKIPFIIHGPHYKHGMNLSMKDTKENNKILFAEACKFADALSSPFIILHSGLYGTIEETISQLKDLKDKRILIENKPYFGLNDGEICVGSTPEEILKAIKETGYGFCLDIGHAIYSANAHKTDPMAYLNRFLALSPAMFHLTDGNINATRDKHEHIGRGNFPLKAILGMFPSSSSITVETVKSFRNDLADFIEDINNIMVLL